MGDRSWGRFMVAARDAERARGIIEPDEEDPSPDVQGAILMSFDESPGGGFHEAQGLREAGIPFEWRWESCPGVYESGRTVFMPGDAEGDAAAQGVFARVDPDGWVDAESLANARQFITLSNDFKEYVKAEA